MTHPFASTPKGAVIGIDPGRSGAIAILDTERWLLGVLDMPVATVRSKGKDRDEPHVTAIAELIKEINPILICAEKMWCNPNLPNADTIFGLGRWRGQLEGIVATSQVGFEHVEPHVWKAKMGTTADKKISVLRANALFPKCTHLWKLVKHNDRAEAALLALYGCLIAGITPTKPIGELKLLEPR
jgi:Holliday junction resolvasome RuvABC endonuclease subunit